MESLTGYVREQQELKRSELEKYKMEARKIKSLLHNDMLYQILQWLPVKSLLRFKLVCRTWRDLIKSRYFNKQHLHLHHYDPNMKDKKHNLIYLLRGKASSITFAITSTEGFKEPNVCLQLNSSDLHGYFAIKVLSIVSYNGIICLNLLNHNKEQSICLWNPATKQSRVLPQSAPNKAFTMVGFGFDVKSNDYKVVNLIESKYTNDKRIMVFSLNTGSWRSVTAVFPSVRFAGNPRTAFNNGTCFFWLGYNSCLNTEIICFDFCSEMFRSISGPYSDCCSWLRCASVVNDKIACVKLRRNDFQAEMWVFNEYGRTNESWTKLYTISYRILDLRPSIDIVGVSMNGNYIFFKTREQQMCRFNAVTRETTYFSLEKMPCSFDKTLVEFKESLVSVLDA